MSDKLNKFLLNQGLTYVPDRLYSRLEDDTSYRFDVYKLDLNPICQI